MDDRGYILIDGSRLFASIFEVWRTRKSLKDRPVNIGRLAEVLVRTWSLNMGSFMRTMIYVKPKDGRLREMVVVPKGDVPGAKDHWKIIECGMSIGAVPERELQKVSAKYRDHFARAEKGLDIKLACDALLRVASGRASNVVFLVNDRDYVPLFESIHNLGGNTYLTGLDSRQRIQRDLARLADKYLTLDEELDHIFGVTEPEAPPTLLQQEPGSEARGT